MMKGLSEDHVALDRLMRSLRPPLFRSVVPRYEKRRKMASLGLEPGVQSKSYASLVMLLSKSISFLARCTCFVGHGFPYRGPHKDKGNLSPNDSL
jgi:hypothetical protein